MQDAACIAPGAALSLELSRNISYLQHSLGSDFGPFLSVLLDLCSTFLMCLQVEVLGFLHGQEAAAALLCSALLYPFAMAVVDFQHLLQHPGVGRARLWVLGDPAACLQEYKVEALPTSLATLLAPFPSHPQREEEWGALCAGTAWSGLFLHVGFRAFFVPTFKVV